jgi:hypothetical protein
MKQGALKGALGNVTGIVLSGDDLTVRCHHTGRRQFLKDFVIPFSLRDEAVIQLVRAGNLAEFLKGQIIDILCQSAGF